MKSGGNLKKVNPREFLSRPPAIPHTIVGNVRHFTGVRSEVLDNQRDVWVYLPAGYDGRARRRYPVLYCQDGQNMMDAATAFLGVEWQLDECLEQGIAAGEIEPLIAVCVSNTPRRAYEYTPVRDSIMGGGGADAYVRFLTEELKPLIDERFRTLPEPEHTGTIGSSLGGLLSLHIALNHSHRFGRVGAVSPSYGWAQGEILQRMAALRTPPPVRLWIDMGTREGPSHLHPNPLVQAGRFARNMLMAAGMRLDGDLAYIEAPFSDHNEAAWASRLPKIMRFLFPGPNLATQTRSTRAAVRSRVRRTRRPPKKSRPTTSRPQGRQ